MVNWVLTTENGKSTTSTGAAMKYRIALQHFRYNHRSFFIKLKFVYLHVEFTAEATCCSSLIMCTVGGREGLFGEAKEARGGFSSEGREDNPWLALLDFFFFLRLNRRH
jgi:hypothetical protein